MATAKKTAKKTGSKKAAPAKRIGKDELQIVQAKLRGYIKSLLFNSPVPVRRSELLKNQRLWDMLEGVRNARSIAGKVISNMESSGEIVRQHGEGKGWPITYTTAQKAGLAVPGVSKRTPKKTSRADIRKVIADIEIDLVKKGGVERLRLKLGKFILDIGIEEA
jgi:hypothetical protein